MEMKLASWASFGAFTWYMKIHDTTDWARPLMDGEQYRNYCRAAGRVLGYTLHDLLEPIYAEYPELTPEVLRPSHDEDAAPGCSPPALEGTQQFDSLSDFRRAVLGLADSVEINLLDIVSLAQMRCSPGEAASIRQRIDEVLEQVKEWRDFLVTFEEPSHEASR